MGQKQKMIQYHDLKKNTRGLYMLFAEKNTGFQKKKKTEYNV